MSKIKVVKGEIHIDRRGKIASLNNFRFDGVNRVYFITHPNIEVIRGWHGHKLEKKWFYCVRGAFTIGLVEIDDWDNPSKSLKPTLHLISDKDSQIICIPEGYASCIKAEIPNSTLMVLSGKTMEDAQATPDSYRWDPNYWFDWESLYTEE